MASNCVSRSLTWSEPEDKIFCSEGPPSLQPPCDPPGLKAGCREEGRWILIQSSAKGCYWDSLPRTLNMSGGKMKTNGETSETHTRRSISCCLHPLWERQAGIAILRTASQSGAGAVRISREEEVLFPDHFLSSLGFSDFAASVRGQYSGSLRRWVFWPPKGVQSHLSV